MRTHLHWFAAAVIVLAGLVFLILGDGLAGSALMALGCAVYAAGVALGPRVQASVERHHR